MGAHRHRDADRRRTHGAGPVQRRRGGAGDRRALRPTARKAALDAREGAYAMKAVGRTGEARAGWAMASPALAAILLFFALPAGASLFLSFTDFDIYALADIGNLRFVGFQNYDRLVENLLFWTAMTNTRLFVEVEIGRAHV